jgi:hypothetical protein
VNAPALILRQPWASLVAHDRKDVENRSWRPPTALIGHDVLIVAGRGHDDGPAVEIVGPGIVAIARLAAVTRDSASPWAIPRCWHWALDRVARLARPVPVRGMPGLFSAAAALADALGRPLSAEADLRSQIAPLLMPASLSRCAV